MKDSSTPDEATNPHLPALITSLVGAVCRVCGARLSPPVVACPRCEAPHHADCWDYNGGCSTYGCREQIATALVTEELPPTQVVSGADLFFEAFDPRQNASVMALLLLAVWRLTPAPWNGLLFWGAILSTVVIGVRRTWLAQREPPQELETESARALAERTEDSTALEVKAVRTLIGAGYPHALAQAYALFEQRHPRRSLPGEDQAKLAAELGANGYRVLALEALDKSEPCAPRGPDASDPLEEARDGLLAGELAYAVVPAAEDTGTILPSPHARFRLAAFRKAGLPGDGPVCLASLSPAGWPWDIRNALLGDAHADASAVPDRGWLLAGPYEPDRARELLNTLWDRGHPAVALTPDEVALDATPEPVAKVQLSQEEARFTVGAKSLDLPWSAIRAVFYGMLVLEHNVLDRPPAQPRVYDLLKPAQTEDATSYRAVIEVHVADGRRLRIDHAGPDVFRYLGRRLRYVEGENLRLVAKDLVRFAPQARASHGVLGLMMERLLPGGRFEGQPQLEEYVRWFVALGREPVRQRLADASGA